MLVVDPTPERDQCSTWNSQSILITVQVESKSPLCKLALLKDHQTQESLYLLKNCGVLRASLEVKMRLFCSASESAPSTLTSTVVTASGYSTVQISKVIVSIFI